MSHLIVLFLLALFVIGVVGVLALFSIRDVLDRINAQLLRDSDAVRTRVWP